MACDHPSSTWLHSRAFQWGSGRDWAGHHRVLIWGPFIHTLIDLAVWRGALHLHCKQCWWRIASASITECSRVPHSVIDSQGFPTTSLQLQRWVLFIFSDKAGNDIKCLMPWNMCWDPVSNVAEVWCCSEHYLWLFDGDLYLDPFAAVYCCCVVVFEDAKTT